MEFQILSSIFVIVMIIMSLSVIAVSIAIAVLQFIAQWKLFEKADEKGWTSIIPIYNFFQMVKISTGNYNLAWIYMGINAVYVVLTAITNFIVGFSSDDECGILYILMLLILFALLIPMYAIAGYVMFMFGKAYGKSTAWNVCMIFFAPILIIIMGFNKNTFYIGPKGIPQNYT